jgi:hypothetical protein
MDVPLSQYIPPPPLEDQFKAILELQEEQTISADTKRSRVNKKKKTKQQIAEEQEQMALFEQAKQEMANPWK